MLDKPLLIAGSWRAPSGSRTGDVVDPATGAVIGKLGYAEAADVDAALEAARKGFATWRAMTALERARILHRAAALVRERAEVMAQHMTREQGKPLAEARAECLMAADLIQWYAEEARRVYGRVVPARQPDSRMTVLKQPVGPVAAFSPWNFPLVLSARKLGGALAAGCSIVLKGAEETPASVAAMVACLAEELPPGALQLVYGVPAEVSEALIASPVIRKLSFTGSVPVGRHLAQLAGRHLKRITLELGGHAPVIVCEDADLARTVPLMVAHKFRNAGQACLAPTRFYVARRLYVDFIDAFAQASRALVLGPGLAPGTQMGPLANQRRRAAVLDLIERSVQRGARRLAGEAPAVGCFVAPTLLADAPQDAPAMQDEPFGPVACVAPFDQLDEAIARANDNAYGLAGYLFTDSAKAILKVSERLEVGSLAINGLGVSVPEAPFGGVKDSGHGSESGIEGMEAYLDTRFTHFVA